jgi:hypothetical protein
MELYTPTEVGLYAPTQADLLLPDSLVDGSGSSDWKQELSPRSREVYRELGLTLYRASSQEEMAVAMKGLQQFERQHRERRKQGGGRGAESSAILSDLQRRERERRSVGAHTQ